MDEGFCRYLLTFGDTTKNSLDVERRIMGLCLPLNKSDFIIVLLEHDQTVCFGKIEII